MSDTFPDPFSRAQSLRAFGVPLRIPVSAQNLASDNLIGKALRDWDADRGRAMAYLNRAAKFPYDQTEQVFPVVWAAHMVLFDEVTDAAEQAAPDDRGWLDAAITVLHEADEFGRIDLADVLRTVSQDWRLTRRESETIAKECTSVPLPEDPMDPLLPTDVVVERTAAIIAAVVRYRAVLAGA